MKGIKDARAFDRMIDRKKTYVTLSAELEKEGLVLTPKKVWRYITHRDTPNKSVKKAIAKALDCLVSDIF